MQRHSKGSAGLTADHRGVFAEFVAEVARLIGRSSGSRSGRGPRIVEVGR
ncbi:hypothetical protein AB7M35_004098 [Amorphus suaedae]